MNCHDLRHLLQLGLMLLFFVQTAMAIYFCSLSQKRNDDLGLLNNFDLRVIDNYGLQKPHGLYPANIASSLRLKVAVQLIQLKFLQPVRWNTFEFTLP
jgi:hypothetical protein